MMNMTIQELKDKTQDLAAQELLKKVLKEYHPEIGLACSFSIEDIVIAHMMKSLVDTPVIFAIDTGRLHEETYECAENMRLKLGLAIHWFFPDRDAVESLEHEKGLYSFRESLENRHECCGIRKVEPLNRALESLSGWITGQRSEQSITRNSLERIQLDQAHGGIIKINPLADWSEEKVWEYIRLHKLPYNRLHDQGFPSIGCSPCTRPIREGEHPRAGRWWWEDPENKECGLHLTPDRSR
jgi:phosphoadenosine phosphosulfate reductase